MNSALKISDFGLKLIKAFEGYRSEPVTLITGQRVIGYGHILTDDDPREMTREAAELFLRDDLEPFEALVRDTVFAPLSQSQFDALVSLAFNIGEDAFRNSHVRHALNNGRILDAANAFDVWRKANVDGRIYVVDALVRRRTAEKALFLRHKDFVSGASRDYIQRIKDQDISDISDDAAIYDHDIGVVDQAPYAKKPASFRRAEDGPAGQLGLSEIPERRVTDPRNDIFIEDTQIAELDNDGPVLGIPDFNESLYREDKADDVRAEYGREPKGDSPIAEAAKEVSERLDALIGGVKKQNAPKAAPEDDILDLKLETALIEDDFRPANDRDDHPLAGKQEPAPAPKPGFIINADVDQGPSVHMPAAKPESSGLPYGIMMFIGGCLLAGGLTSYFTGQGQTGLWLQLLTPMAIIFGGIMLLAAFYYALKRAF